MIKLVADDELLCTEMHRTVGTIERDVCNDGPYFEPDGLTDYNLEDLKDIVKILEKSRIEE